MPQPLVTAASTDPVSRVAVLGLGNMGGTLARALTAGGLHPTVWNRDRDKSAGFEHVATTAAEAIASADLIVACLADYPATRELLASPGVAAALPGRTLVQLASGTPQEARELAAWADDANVEYLDGKIFTYPARIGAQASVIAYSGSSAELFERHRMPLQLMAGASAYAATDAGAAASLDLAWLSVLYGATVGILQGAAFCRANGVDLSAMFALIPAWLHEVEHEAAYYDRLLEADRFEGDQATIDVHLAAMQHLLAATRSDAHLDDAFPAYLVALMSSLSARGMGELEIAAAIRGFES